MSKIRYKNHTTGVFFVLLILSQIASIQCVKLTQGDPDVKFEIVNGIYKLTMDENLGKKVLFHIEDAEEVGVEFDKACSDLSYGSTVNNSMFFLENPLDFERSGCPVTTNTVTDRRGGSPAIFQLILNNLDDNAPQFETGSNCKLKENTSYGLEDSPCQLTMTDLDGMMDKADITIKDGSALFGVSLFPIPSTNDKEATVIIYLQDDILLDYEKKTSHVLVVKAQEQTQSGEVQVAIDVVDQPDQPPKFTKMITTEQFEENVDQTFSVSAEDGDIGINSPISYKITKDGCEQFSCEITISELGEINVKNVDREKTGNTIPLTIEAVEEDDQSSTPLSITFNIIDQDDEWPKISVDKWDVSVDEGYKGTITKFSVEDMDLSDFGTYSIKMDNGESSIDYTKAFELIPDSGYQKASFSLVVGDSTLLDFENKDWKKINFNILAIEKADDTHRDSHQIIINLNDINDEPPIFVNKSESVDISEDIKAGQQVFDAIAVDADEGDVVSYEIVGVWKQKLDISKNGIITTKSDNTFDYEQQPEVIITIRASDNDNTHITSKTLTINVIDVDDEPPVMRVITSNENKMVKIPENSKSGTVVDGVSILVSDPDTEPQLKLEIDWKASYVTKNAKIETFDDDVYQCFSVVSISKTIQIMEGTILISEACSPDFEKFDAIVLFLKATDQNTKIGDDSTKGSVLINIEDVNDNIPNFIESSLKDLAVTDGTNTQTKIGVISAHDDDISDDIFFSIEPVDKKADWVDIDEKTGQLTVKKDVVIDCDEPKRQDISFFVTVRDPDPAHLNTTQVSIHIIDINDEYPHIKWSETEVTIDEQSSDGIRVATLDATDADRDDPNNRVVFKFETNLTDEASNRFSISEDGKIVVELRNGAALDRDKGPVSYKLPIVAYDNPKGILQLKDHFDLKVILRDLDNNIPFLENTSLSCLENLNKDETLGIIVAYDPDEDGPNSDVSFVLTEVSPIEKENKNNLDKEFFEINKNDAKKATIKIAKDLKGYWGKFNLTIRTEDKGNPDASNDNIITLTVEKFNFKEPVFNFPKTESDKKITIDEDLTSPKRDIILINGETLKQLEVNDEQDHKWYVTFQIKDEDGGTEDIFTITESSDCSWKADLRLARSLSDEELSKDHTVTVNATLKNDQKKGEASVSVETTFTIKFFGFSEKPKFKVNQGHISIAENSMAWMDIPEKASYPDMPDLKPYYFISEASDTFKVDTDNGTISLIHELDYEQRNEYNIKIIAMNKRIPPIDPSSEGPNNVLSLTINVIDVNDNSPVFTPKKFTGAFLRTYSKGTTILTVNATDADPTLQTLTFSLKNFDCSPTLKAPDVPFSIGPSDGKITNQFTVTSDMSGFCNFLVEVQDEKSEVENDIVHVLDTTVQINVISNDELVKFTFMNTDWDVDQKLDSVISMINDAFKEYQYTSFLADLIYDPTWHNTTAHFYFTNRQSEPVAAEEILGNLTDPNKYSTLAKTLETVEVHLYYFSNENVTKVVDDYLKIWMIAAICVLGSLLALVTIIFFFRNKALTRRINNLSTTKFGSQDSGLNRAGVTAPTTNKNAIEGSNPVFNSESYIKEVEDDRISVLSGDSDLLGVENNPVFDF